jgi:hypothetical protein
LDEESLASGLTWRMAAAVDPDWEREPLIVAAMDESVVLPARWANDPLSARRREGVREGEVGVAIGGARYR